MSDENDEIQESVRSDSSLDKLVPVAESIKYRRRAQQAETRTQQIEQQLKDAQSQLQSRAEELALAEAQRDEAHRQISVLENRSAAELELVRSGAVDVETASLLLSKRMDFGEQVDRQELSKAVEQLLLDKPYLRSQPIPAGKTASARRGQPGTAAQVAQAAQKACKSGDRRDVAEYLRLRRQAAGANK
ncbi:MAG: hypothetical protein HZA50_04490 [Planctomycetes bacterium]|nr:hypothetical protein [Planctomycetota bacterium]